MPDVLTPAEKRILELTRRGHEDAVIAVTFGVRLSELRKMREAAQAKLRAAQREQEEAWWNR